MGARLEPPFSNRSNEENEKVQFYEFIYVCLYTEALY